MARLVHLPPERLPTAQLPHHQPQTRGSLLTQLKAVSTDGGRAWVALCHEQVGRLGSHCRCCRCTAASSSSSCVPKGCLVPAVGQRRPHPAGFVVACSHGRSHLIIPDHTCLC